MTLRDLFILQDDAHEVSNIDTVSVIIEEDELPALNNSNIEVDGHASSIYQ